MVVPFSVAEKVSPRDPIKRTALPLTEPRKVSVADTEFPQTLVLPEVKRLLYVSVPVRAVPVPAKLKDILPTNEHPPPVSVIFPLQVPASCPFAIEVRSNVAAIDGIGENLAAANAFEFVPTVQEPRQFSQAAMAALTQSLCWINVPTVHASTATL
jgi:hypothetical protein